MLTEIQYQDLWTSLTPQGFNMPLHLIPSYYQYLQREIYQQDYLDLFGAIVAQTFPRFHTGNNWYVKIPGLRPDPHYTTNIGGQEYLAVDYDFPYPKTEIAKHKISYIMIGEAAPSSAIPHFDINGNDLENSYFYNVKHQKNTQYFTAPCNAFGVVGATKNDKLLHLASKGVILLDLFPFAYSYSGTIRTALNNNNVTFDFWHNLNNNYSVASRLRHLPVAQNCKGALIAPPIISHHIAAGLNFGLNFGHAVAPVGPPYPNLGLVFRMGVNTFLPHHFHFNNHFFNGIPPGTNLIPWYAAIPAYPLFGITSVPIYCSCCYSGAGTVPHELFIRNAFGIV